MCIRDRHQVLLEHVAKETHKLEFKQLKPEQQTEVRADNEERYYSYMFLKQSGKQHNKLWVDLSNDYTTGDDRHPKTCQTVLHLLDKYSKSTVIAPTAQEGSSFTQRGGPGAGGGDGRHGDAYDKKYWKNLTCYKCDKKGHPSSHCPDKAK